MESFTCQKLALSQPGSSIAPTHEVKKSTNNLAFPIFRKILLVIAVLSASITGLTDVALAQHILKQGDRGSQVRSLQEALNKLGYSTSPDGIYGIDTEKAVKKFQQKNNLPDTGKVDDQTWQEIMSINDSRPNPDSSTRLNEPILPWGEKSEKVGLLQRRLEILGFYNGPINNIFDLATRDAVSEFQKESGIKPPIGAVGRTTWEHLFSSEKNIYYPNPNNDEPSKTISLVQKRLQMLGYFNYPEITTYFGKETLRALKEFQQSKGIKPVGLVGPTTWDALFNWDAVFNDMK